METFSISEYFAVMNEQNPIVMEAVAMLEGKD